MHWWYVNCAFSVVTANIAGIYNYIYSIIPILSAPVGIVALVLHAAEPLCSFFSESVVITMNVKMSVYTLNSYMKEHHYSSV